MTEEIDGRYSYQQLPSRNRTLSHDSLHTGDTEETSSENEDKAKNELSNGNDEKSSKQPAMSNKRRLCLVGSLLLCAFTVFAFAFILPCHHKTCLKEIKCKQKNWSKNFTGVAPLVVRELNSNNETDPWKHLLVGFSHNGRGFHILNHTCPACHGGVVSVDGRNGHQLWTSGILGKLGNVLCDLNIGKQRQKSCVALENKNRVLRIDSHSGYQKWTKENPGIIVALKTIRDIDGDGVGEIVLLYSRRREGMVKRVDRTSVVVSELCVLSGKTGKVVGTTLPVLLPRGTATELQHDGFLLVHKLSAKAQILLIGIKLESQETGTLLAIKIRALATRVQNRTNKENEGWGKHTPNRYGFIELFKDSLVLTKPMFADLNNDGIEDIVLCTLDRGLTVKAINGKDTKQMWSKALTSRDIHKALPTIVSFGDKVKDIALMLQLNNRSTRIVVLNGRNGLALWMFSLNNPLTVPPVGVPQSKHIPHGLLLWLPKLKVNKYITKRDAIMSLHQRRKNGPRKKRSAWSLREDEEENIIDLVEGLLNENENENNKLGNDRERNKGVEEVGDDNDDGDDDDEDDDDDNEDDDDDDNLLQQMKLQSVKERDVVHTGDVERKELNALFSSLQHPQEPNHSNKDNEDSNNNVLVDKNHIPIQRKYNDDTDDDSDVDGHDEDDNNGIDSDDIAIETMKTLQSIDSHEQQSLTPKNVTPQSQLPHDKMRTVWRDFLKNLENRLRRETLKGTTPSSSTPTTRMGMEFPTTQYKDNNAGNQNHNVAQRHNQTENDKPMTCIKPLDKGNKDISAVLVYRDPKHQLKLIRIIDERAITIAPEEYLNKFGEQPPTPYSCIEFVPFIRTKPLITDIDGDGHLDLIYTVDYITPLPEDRTTHFMKLKKVDLEEILVKKTKKKPSHLYSSSTKEYKRNEDFETPFLRWNTD